MIEEKGRTKEIYNRLDEIKACEKEYTKKEDEIIHSKPAKDINKKLKQLIKNCPSFDEEKYRLKNELKKLYEEKRKKHLGY